MTKHLNWGAKWAWHLFIDFFIMTIYSFIYFSFCFVLSSSFHLSPQSTFYVGYSLLKNSV